MEQMHEELLPIRVFAQRLGISVWTARSMAYRGRIASCKIGAKLQIPVTEVHRLIAENMRPQTKVEARTVGDKTLPKENRHRTLI
jgi:hypothetical protein